MRRVNEATQGRPGRVAGDQSHAMVMWFCDASDFEMCIVEAGVP
jgi:hypothetical protein